MNIIAICSLADLPGMPPPLPGSEFRPCADCGLLCVLSPSTVQREPTFVLCHKHGWLLVELRPDLMLKPTEEAVAEFLEDQRRQRALRES